MNVWERERLNVGVSVHARGSGVAIVRVDGRFIGRCLRVGAGWQAWARTQAGPLDFLGWSARRIDAVLALVDA